MDKAALNARLERLQTEQKRLQADLLAYDGAIQECQHWIKEMENAEKTEGPEEGR